ncbi:MAG TPA: peptidylprolyl isomerase, partial [Stellaceae bacterium]|nr:peptidylprolyl isomerase [Stellaceae bacterium]
SELKEMLPPLSPAQAQQAARDPKIATQLVRGAISRKLILDEAEKQNWAKRPDVAAQIERAKSEIIIASFLQSASQPSPGYPSEDEVRQAYEANKDKFTIQPQYHLSQIYLAVPAGAKKEVAAAAEKKARELARKARAKGADFAALARSESEDKVSAPRGGDLGWLEENQLVPEIAAAVKAMHGKGISEPINAAGGWHIIEITGTVPATHPALDQVHDAIVKLLREAKANAYVQKLLDDKHLTVNETAAVQYFAAKP